MQTRGVRCPECGQALNAGVFNHEEMSPCGGCGKLLRVMVFPALYLGNSGFSQQIAAAEGESSCFYHPQKQAVVPCESCGRFLCSLCDLDFNGKHLCPSCLDTGAKKGRIEALQTARFRYDLACLALATLPLILVWLTLVTAPIALYMSIKHRSAPCGLLHKSKLCFNLAAFLSALQVLGWIIFIIAIF